jgi:hypothetical protein
MANLDRRRGLLQVFLFAFLARATVAIGLKT